ncbi:MAG: T9SS type A sorting domain-containing protein [Sporocytophaga sp.]|nr:T9SS type A sorting domain-containing protein [Sporocytophaga sp.]
MSQTLTIKKIKKIDSSGIVTTVLENLIDPGVITIEKRYNILYFDDNGAIKYYDFSYPIPLRITEESGIPLRAEMLHCEEYLRPIFSHRGGLFKIEEDLSTGKRIIKQITYSYYTSCTFSSTRGTVFGSGANLYKFDSYNNTFNYIEIYPLVTNVYPNKDFKDIQGMIIDENENLFMADRGTNRILKMDKFGTISTFAGDYESGLIDGNGTKARFNGPSRLAWDNYGNILVTDNNTLRKISPNGDVTTVKDASQKPLYALGCYGIAVDQNDNIFLAQYGGGQTIKKITPDNVISDYIDKKFMKSFGYDFGMPFALQIDKLGNLIIAIQLDGMLYIVSPDKSKVRWIGDFAGSSIDGHTRNADFRAIEDIILDKDGNLFVLDVNTIRKISPDSLVTTIVGEASKNSGLSGGYKEGIGSEIRMNFPWCMTMNKNGDFYISDNGNNLIRVIRKNVVTGINESGIEETEVSGFNVFPNPTNDKITVHSSFEGSLGVYNIDGKLVFKNTNSPKEVTIDFKNYSKGLYYVVFQTSDKMYKKTLVVE